jgi:hypothetical protein
LGPMGIFDLVGIKTAFDICMYWGTVNKDAQMLTHADYLKSSASPAIPTRYSSTAFLADAGSDRVGRVAHCLAEAPSAYFPEPRCQCAHFVKWRADRPRGTPYHRSP